MTALHCIATGGSTTANGVGGAGLPTGAGGASAGLAAGAATSANQATEIAALGTINTTLGTPFQAGGSVGISGTLPALAATPTFNLGTLNGAATAGNQTAVQSAPGTPQTTAMTIQGNASGVAVPVSVASQPLPTGAATAANQHVTAAGTSDTSAQAMQGVTGAAAAARRVDRRFGHRGQSRHRPDDARYDERSGRKPEWNLGRHADTDYSQHALSHVEHDGLHVRAACRQQRHSGLDHQPVVLHAERRRRDYSVEAVYDGHALDGVGQRLGAG